MYEKRYISVTERKFINYITKYLHGEKLSFLKGERANRYESIYDNEKLKSFFSYEQKFISDWKNSIESKDLYSLINKLPYNQKFIIVNNLLDSCKFIPKYLETGRLVAGWVKPALSDELQFV